MTTTPPTAAETDAFLAATNEDSGGTNMMYMADFVNGGNNISVIPGQGDMVMWVVAYTDNADQAHYEGLGIGYTGMLSSSDTAVEAAAPVQDNFPFFQSGNAIVPSPSEGQAYFPLPYINALVQAYGEILIRGYLMPGVPLSFTPADNTVQAWVNDSTSWAAAS
jgi:hypothetical protein